MSSPRCSWVTLWQLQIESEVGEEQPSKDSDSKLEKVKAEVIPTEAAQIEEMERVLEREAKAELQQVEAWLQQAEARLQQAKEESEKARAQYQQDKAELRQAKEAGGSGSDHISILTTILKVSADAYATRVKDVALCVEWRASAGKEYNEARSRYSALRDKATGTAMEPHGVGSGIANNVVPNATLDYALRPDESISPRAVRPWPTETQKDLNERPPNHRRDTAKYYHRYRNTRRRKNQAQCHVTNLWGNAERVVCTHLLSHAPARHQLKALDLDPKKGLSDSRNTMLLAKNIERAFDKCQLTFVLDAFRPGCYEMKVWDSSVKQTPIFRGSPSKIGDFDGTTFEIPEEKTPYTRILSWHAQISYQTALSRGWINDTVPKPAEFGSPLKNDAIYVACGSSIGGTASTASAPSRVVDE